MHRNVNFVLEVNYKFNAHAFMAEFKKLQFQGHFKDIEFIRQIDESGNDVEVKMQKK